MLLAGRQKTHTSNPIPPTVQNCPNRFSEATRSPFGSTVTCVLLAPWCCTVAYVSGGISASGCVSGGSSVTISSDGTLTVLAPASVALALPLAAVCWLGCASCALPVLGVLEAEKCRLQALRVCLCYAVVMTII